MPIRQWSLMSCCMTSGVEQLATKPNCTTVLGGASASRRQEQLPPSHSMITVPSPGVVLPCSAMQSALIAQLGSNVPERRGLPVVFSSCPALANLKLPRRQFEKTGRVSGVLVELGLPTEIRAGGSDGSTGEPPQSMTRHEAYASSAVPKPSMDFTASPAPDRPRFVR